MKKSDVPPGNSAYLRKAKDLVQIMYPSESATAGGEIKRGSKIWVECIRYEIRGNLGSDRSLNTYTNQPPAPCNQRFGVKIEEGGQE